MARHPMVEQVDRLVGNLLAGGGEVFLPGVGSLYCEWHGARRLSKRLVAPPCRTVAFSSHARGVSLVDEIARMIREAQPDPTLPPEEAHAQAQDIYDRWLDKTRVGDVLTVEGVGVLKQKTFISDPAFDKRINPQGREPVRIGRRRRFDWALAAGCAAILVGAAIGGYVFLAVYPDGNVPQTAIRAVDGEPDAADRSSIRQEKPGVAAGGLPAETAGASDAITPIASAESGAAGTDVPAASAAARSVPSGAARSAGSSAVEAPARSAESVADAPARLISGRRYVVLGVFSTPENAGRAAREAAEKDRSLLLSIYRFGEKFMLSPFESDDAQACKQFIRAHAGDFPGMWTYTAR